MPKIMTRTTYSVVDDNDVVIAIYDNLSEAEKRKELLENTQYQRDIRLLINEITEELANCRISCEHLTQNDVYLNIIERKMDEFQKKWTR
jgi:hypothetical protein